MHGLDLFVYQMVFKKLVVVDGRGHLLGRMASTVAKELLSGQKVVCSSCVLMCIRRTLAFIFIVCVFKYKQSGIIFLLYVVFLRFVCLLPLRIINILFPQVICRAEEVNISGSFFRNKRTFSSAPGSFDVMVCVCGPISVRRQSLSSLPAAALAVSLPCGCGDGYSSIGIAVFSISGGGRCRLVASKIFLT
jgi:hypothetical protein